MIHYSNTSNLLLSLTALYSKNIWKSLVMLFFLGFFLISISSYANNKSIIWEDGIALINGKPKYFDPLQLTFAVIALSDEFIKRQPGEIIRAMELEFANDKGIACLYTHDVIKNTREMIYTSEKMFYCKIANQTLFLSTDKKSWQKLDIVFLNNKPFMYKGMGVKWKVYLKSKFFEGEYLFITTAMDGPQSISEYYQSHVIASSVLIEEKMDIDRYASWKVIDGKPSTAWVAANMYNKNGIEDYIEFSIGDMNISAIEILPGLAANTTLYGKNNRPREIEISIRGDRFSGNNDHVYLQYLHTIEDKMQFQKIIIPGIESLIKSSQWKKMAIRFTLKSVYNGTVYADTCISEIRIFDKNGNDLAKILRNEALKRGFK